jgi:hypothetical protein
MMLAAIEIASTRWMLVRFIIGFLFFGCGCLFCCSLTTQSRAVSGEAARKAKLFHKLNFTEPPGLVEQPVNASVAVSSELQSRVFLRVFMFIF